MSEQRVGSIGWHDLTCENADGVREFYRTVAGWEVEPVDMGDYSDYAMLDDEGNAVSGVCHKQGVNADMPSSWLMYIIVADLKSSTANVSDLGGKVLVERVNDDGTGFAVIEDPAGAVCALYQSE